MLDTVPSVQGGGSMLRDLLLAIGIGLIIVLSLLRWLLQR
jgi:hypothetical protein